MKKNRPYLLFLLLCTPCLHTTEIKKDCRRDIHTIKTDAPELQSPLLNNADKDSFRLNPKALPLTSVTGVYIIHGLGIGNALISQPFALLGAAFFGAVLLYPESTKNLFEKAACYCGKNCKLETYTLTESYLRLRGLQQN